MVGCFIVFCAAIETAPTMRATRSSSLDLIPILFFTEEHTAMGRMRALCIDLCMPLFVHGIPVTSHKLQRSVTIVILSQNECHLPVDSVPWQPSSASNRALWIVSWHYLV